MRVAIDTERLPTLRQVAKHDVSVRTKKSAAPLRAPRAQFTTFRGTRTTSMRMEGIPTSDVRYRAAENGQPFLTNVKLNEQTRVFDRKQIPAETDTKRFTSWVDSWKQVINQKPLNCKDSEGGRRRTERLHQQLVQLERVPSIFSIKSNEK